MDFQELFDSQVRALEEAGYPTELMAKFRQQRSEVLTRARLINIGKGNLPFLAVIPWHLYPHEAKLVTMQHIPNHPTRGSLYIIDPNLIIDICSVPEEPYFIFDVDAGEETFGKNAKEGEELVKSQNRSSLTVAEVMAFAFHTDILEKLLKRSAMFYATGSRFWYSDKKDAPIIYAGNYQIGIKPINLDLPKNVLDQLDKWLRYFSNIPGKRAPKIHNVSMESKIATFLTPSCLR